MVAVLRDLLYPCHSKDTWQLCGQREGHQNAIHVVYICDPAVYRLLNINENELKYEVRESQQFHVLLDQWVNQLGSGLQCVQVYINIVFMLVSST